MLLNVLFRPIEQHETTTHQNGQRQHDAEPFGHAPEGISEKGEGNHHPSPESGANGRGLLGKIPSFLRRHGRSRSIAIQVIDLARRTTGNPFRSDYENDTRQKKRQREWIEPDHGIV